MQKKIIGLIIAITLSVIFVSGCIGGDTNGTNTITFSGYSFEVPNGVTGGPSAAGNNALLFYEKSSFNIGTNETIGYSNPNELIYEGNAEERILGNITYLYNIYNGNPEFNQENLITIQVYFTKDDTQYYIIVHTEEGEDIAKIDSIIESIIKTIQPT